MRYVTRYSAGMIQSIRHKGLKRLHQDDDSRTTLSELVNEKRGISPEMAVRLSKVFGGSAESWLTQQAHYDLAQVHADRIKLKRLESVVGLSA
ncbi:MAG TPA: HigA family addiction module antitoxin [Terriglobia bacterium]|nr:HigA family addiction module antitoxin [Terriglobia bacterium]